MVAKRIQYHNINNYTRESSPFPPTLIWKLSSGKSLRQHIIYFLPQALRKHRISLQSVQEHFSFLDVLLVRRAHPQQISLRRRVRNILPHISSGIRTPCEDVIALSALQVADQGVTVGVGVEDAACEAETAHWII